MTCVKFTCDHPWINLFIFYKSVPDEQVPTELEKEALDQQKRDGIEWGKITILSIVQH